MRERVTEMFKSMTPQGRERAFCWIVFKLRKYRYRGKPDGGWWRFLERHVILDPDYENTIADRVG